MTETSAPAAGRGAGGQRGPLRIAVIANQFPALSETFVLNHVIGLLQRGHHVRVFARRPRPEALVHAAFSEYDLAGLTTYAPSDWTSLGNRFPRFYGWIEQSGWETQLWRLIRQTGLVELVSPLAGQSFDIIHCHFGPNGMRAVIWDDVSPLLGKLVTAFHGYDVSILPKARGRRLYAPLFRRGDLFLPVSEFFARRLVALGCPPEKMRVYPMGVDNARFPYRERAIGPDGRVRILSVGRLVEKKGFEIGIRAFVAATRGLPGVEYRIVGDGQLRARLAALVDQLGAADRIHFTGALDHVGVARELDAAHVLLAPSLTPVSGDQEGRPLSIQEAMASGIAVVTSDHAGIPELIEDGKTGWVAPEGDVAGLAERLRAVVTAPERWAERTRAARAFVERHQDHERLIDQLVEIYYELLGRSEPAAVASAQPPAVPTAAPAH